MKHMVRTAIAALAIGVAATAANAQMKEAKDVKIAVVVHGSASDPYWSVVKRGVDDAAALTGAQVQYVSPQVFDEVEQARLIDAAMATKPDGIIVSIADPDALRAAVTGGDRRRHPGDEHRLERGARRGDGRAPSMSAPCRNTIPARRPATVSARTASSRWSASTTRSATSASTIAAAASTTASPRMAAAPKWSPSPPIRATSSAGPRPTFRPIPDVQGVFAMGAGAANPLIPLFKEKELFGKIKLYTFDISPEVLNSIIAGEMELRHGRPAVPDGLRPGRSTWSSTSPTASGRRTTSIPARSSSTRPRRRKAILALAKEGIR